MPPSLVQRKYLGTQQECWRTWTVNDSPHMYQSTLTIPTQKRQHEQYCWSHFKVCILYLHAVLVFHLVHFQIILFKCPWPQNRLYREVIVVGLSATVGYITCVYIFTPRQASCQLPLERSCWLEIKGVDQKTDCIWKNSAMMLHIGHSPDSGGCLKRI